MTQVFCRVHYDVLTMPGFFEEFYKFIGHFQIQQTIEQSYQKVFDLWFFTNEVIIPDGKSRQVEVECNRSEDGGGLHFKIHAT